jgi:hypothetical protein
VSTLKDIKGLTMARQPAPVHNSARLVGNRGSKGIDFERVLTVSLKQLYNNDVRLMQDSSPVVTTPLFDPLQNLTLDDEGKFKEGLKTVMKHEGTRLVKEDGGEESSKYGILQSTAKAYGYAGNLKNLTKADAEQIYKKIWAKAGAASMPHPLSTIHFDTYVNSPSMARKLLRQSQGDTGTYLKLRMQRYSRIAQLRPEKYGKYLNGWVNRVKSLKEIASSYSPPYAASEIGTTSRT